MKVGLHDKQMVEEVHVAQPVGQLAHVLSS